LLLIVIKIVMLVMTVLYLFMMSCFCSTLIFVVCLILLFLYRCALLEEVMLENLHLLRHCSSILRQWIFQFQRHPYVQLYVISSLKKVKGEHLFCAVIRSVKFDFEAQIH